LGVALFHVGSDEGRQGIERESLSEADLEMRLATMILRCDSGAAAGAEKIIWGPLLAIS